MNRQPKNGKGHFIVPLVWYDWNKRQLSDKVSYLLSKGVQEQEIANIIGVHRVTVSRMKTKLYNDWHDELDELNKEYRKYARKIMRGKKL